MLKLILLLSSAAVLIILVLFIFFFRAKCAHHERRSDGDVESPVKIEREEQEEKSKSPIEELKTFHGGEELTVDEILEAPGEVIGKSGYGTLYAAELQRSQTKTVLRFLRPAAAAEDEDLGEAIRFLGGVRHRNLVPLLGFYAGLRGEKLLVHPFYACGNLAEFIRAGNAESHRWKIIHRISLGIAKGLDHLHTALQKPIIHGNLKSKNILLDRNHEPYVSDFGLPLLLNPTATQEMLQVSGASGYKAPELIKMKDATEETDIYSYGIILLELLSGKEPIITSPTADEDVHLSNYVRSAILGRGIADLFHPEILVGDDGGGVAEEELLKCFQLAMTCCSSSPAIRPSFKQVIAKLEEIGR